MEEYNEDKPESQRLQKYKMGLLYSQTQELHYLYSQNLIFHPKNYYLLEKSILNVYKKFNDYSKASEFFQNYEFNYDYEKVKKNLIEAYEDDMKLNIIKENNDLNNKEFIEYIEDDNFNENIVLLKKEFYDEFVNKIHELQIYNVYIGNKLIIIKGNKKKFLYICILDNNDEENSYKIDFNIKVINKIEFNNESQIKDIINKILNDYNNNKLLNVNQQNNNLNNPNNNSFTNKNNNNININPQNNMENTII